MNNLVIHSLIFYYFLLFYYWETTWKTLIEMLLTEVEGILLDIRSIMIYLVVSYFHFISRLGICICVEVSMALSALLSCYAFYFVYSVPCRDHKRNTPNHHSYGLLQSLVFFILSLKNCLSCYLQKKLSQPHDLDY